MATLSDTIKPNKTYLEAVLRTALLGKTEDEYVDFFLSGQRGRLLKNPRLYRSYGPYWPEIKKLLLERGYGNFGRLVDRDVRKFYRYDRPALTLIAATLYSQERFDNGQIYSAWHLLPVPEEVDDQDYEFESYDLEVEALAQAGEKT
ncbi:peptide-binding protein [Escherichia coli]